MIIFISTLFFLNTLLVSKTNGHLFVDKLRLDFLKLEDSWTHLLGQHKYSNKTDDLRSTLIDTFRSYDEKLQKMPQDILYGMEVARHSSLFLFLYSDLRVVNDMYEKFRRFLKNNVTDRNSTNSVTQGENNVQHIINEVLYDPKNNLNKTMRNIFKQIFSNRNDGNDNSTLLSYVTNTVLDGDYMCKGYYQSPQQVFYNLYNTISLAHLKSYVMIQFSYLDQTSLQEGNYTSDSQTARKQFEKTTKNMMLPLGIIIKIMGRKIWNCDPKKHIKESTYDELTALLQGHIENEVDMNSGGTCKQNCAAYPYTKSYGCYDNESSYCQKRKSCNGKILKCKFFESDMTACISSYNSWRRYEYIEYGSGKLLGKKEWCQSKNIHSWYRLLVQCSYCLCLCDQEGPYSDRYFNLRPVLADVANNRVVTGLRIVKHNRIIHLQIQEGKLLPYGYIDPSTVRWVPVDDYKITDKKVQNGDDFHTMNYNQRTMFLDDLQPQGENQIITGVRFEYVNNHLKFGINVHSFNFESGTLSNNSYYIFGSENSSRQNIDIEDTDIPTLSPPSEPHLQNENYIEFTHSSFDKDAAQTTVPFFDVQPVVAHPPVPLKGAGIYYKGKHGYGGFVAPTITTFDFGKNMKLELPKVITFDEEIFPIDP